jgi:hypothetical protein
MADGTDPRRGLFAGRVQVSMVHMSNFRTNGESSVSAETALFIEVEMVAA